MFYEISIHGQLNKHIQSMHGIFAFKCDHCPQKSQFTDNSNKHIQSMHGRFAFMCNQCPTKFQFMDNLNKHSQKMHGTITINITI